MRVFVSKEDIERFAREHAQGDFGCLLTEISGQRLLTIKIRVTIREGYDIGRVD